MCPDREFPQTGQRQSTAGRDADLRRLPPAAAWLVRGTCLAGIIAILISLPMNSDYGTWSWGAEVSPTWRLVVMTLIISAFLVITIPLACWWLLALAGTVAWALHPNGPEDSLFIPLSALGLLIAWVAPWLSVRTWEAVQGRPLWGSFVFAGGFTLMFLSTLPGLYYWIRRRVKPQSQVGTESPAGPSGSGG